MTKIKPRLIARISCQECRRRKTRCNFDGQTQKCSTCTRIGTACIFAQKNGVILDMDKVMEENNPHLVHRREKELRAKERARLAAIEAVSPDSPAQALTLAGGIRGLAPIKGDMSIYSKSTPSSSYLSRDGSASKHNRSSSTSGDAQFKSQSSSTEDLSNVMDRLQIDAFGIAPHTLRSFSQVAGDNDSAQTSQDEDSSDSDSANQDIFTHSDLMDMDGTRPDPKRDSPSSHASPRQRSSRSRSVPLVDIQPDLIDIYFKNVHPFLLVLHKPSFFRRLHDPKDPVPDFLLAAMYAVASHYAPGREEDGRRYFQFWLSRLDDAMDKPRLSTIQALLMVIKYQEGLKRTGFYFRTYMYIQMVVVLARELQLYKTTPVNAKLDPESHEVRRRLFWAIFVLDQFMSVSQGRTMSFREVEPEADLPRTDTEKPNDPEEIEVIENAVEYIKLVKIDHQALILVRKFLTKVVTPEETIPQGLFLHQAMLAWKANLPPRLQLATNMSPHTPFVGMLHILYHGCAIMVERCYCEDPSISHLEIAAVARDTCTASATNITVIIDELYTNHGMVPLSYPIRGCYFIIYCLIAAATVQANDIRQGTNGPIMFKRSLALLSTILRQSTAADIEKEVELLKNSLDTSTESAFSWPSRVPATLSNSNIHHYDNRPPLKPILPMSQKYGPKVNFASSIGSPTNRVRKISPKASTLMSTSGTTPPSPMGSNVKRQNSTKSQFQSQQHDSTCNTSTALSSISPRSDSKSQVPSTSSSSPQMEDDLDMNIKLSPSPDIAKRSICSGLDSEARDEQGKTSPEAFLRSVPMFTAPTSLPSDFTAFAQAQLQALSPKEKPSTPLTMPMAQFLESQQELQRQHHLKQQCTASSDPLAAVQHNQKSMDFQQQQDPAYVDMFLNSFSNLNSYQQMNTDQAHNELLSMLDTSMFNQTPLQMSSTFGAGISSTPFGNQFISSSNIQIPQQQYQQQDRQRTASSDESLMADAAMSKSHLQDTPSPDTFAPLDMASSFPTYIGVDNTVPFAVRQALGDMDKMFKLQLQAELAGE
ncbi:hypothetical protein BG011_006433 [Mortierella polycephala]|uniref:Zn(2)-C6 fungal-type domain-containing protein n=1 Tax=Mortierella polycephala TaxID=41804 RepID=A0A9P6PW33_9FUNG|nr:hypothetical protein BG011_006433 [Mortierella polycephala]